MLPGAFVTPDFFDMLGVKPLLGRTFVPEEGQPGRDQVAVLSHALWQRECGADAHLIGRSIRLDGKTYIGLGVMPEEFGFPIAARLGCH
jgi:putative ABC transport system permease protein